MNRIRLKLGGSLRLPHHLGLSDFEDAATIT